MTSSKFKNLVHRIIHDCSDDPGQLGAVRLNKILWFSDMIAYQVDGKPITNEVYVKRQFGPAPRSMPGVLRHLEDQGVISVTRPEFEFEPMLLESLKEPKSRLTNREKHIVSAVTEAVLGKSVNQISDMSHDMIWEIAEQGEQIPLYATLAAIPASVEDEDVEWAIGQLKGNLPRTANA